MTKLINLVKKLNFSSRNWGSGLIKDQTNVTYCVTRRFSDLNLKCWNCGAEKRTHEIFCVKCNLIQPPESKNNYFKVLGIKETYDIDAKELVQRFRSLQSLLHPDKYSNKSQDEKDISQDYSSVLNTAYTNLLSPINRGLHLLSLKGAEITENDNSSDDKNFLMEIMEMNEEVEEADTPEKLLELNKKNREILSNITQELSETFRKNDILEAKNVLIRLKYYNSISKQINGLLREKGIVEE